MTAEDARTRLKSLASPAAATLATRFFKTGPGEYGEGIVDPENWTTSRTPLAGRLIVVRGARMNKSPRVHTLAFKAQVALTALNGDRTFSEIAVQYQVHVKLVQAWKKQLLGKRPRSSAAASSRRP